MGMRGSSFIRRHSFPRRFSSKNSGLSSKEDGTFSDSDGGGGASELDMADAYSDKHHKKLEADMNTSIARKE